jgi:phenylacetate-CoA ligase
MNIFLLLVKIYELARNERRRPDELARMRLKKFRRLVRLINRRSPYYSRIIRESGIDIPKCVPEDFPVLTKRMLMEHFDEVVTRPDITKDRIADFLSRSKDPLELYKGKFIVLHTSGSSGEIGYFVYSLADWYRGYAQLGKLQPFSFRRRTAAYFGATQGHFAGVSLFLASRRSFLKLFYRAESFEINGPLKPVVERLNTLQPDILGGYPSGLQMLAQKQLAGELKISPSFINSGGEPLGPDARSVIEKAFKAHLLDVYASTEHMAMAIMNPRSGENYLLEDDLIFEFHPDYTCVTNLFNRTLPLIRYRMEDVIEPIPGNGSARTRIKGIVGRAEYPLIFINRHGMEDFISPIVIVELHAKGLRRFQICLLSKTAFLFRACWERGLNAEERKKALAEIQNKLATILNQKEMENVSFTIEEVDDLPLDPKTGKFRLITMSGEGC